MFNYTSLLRPRRSFSEVRTKRYKVKSYDCGPDSEHDQADLICFSRSRAGDFPCDSLSARLCHGCSGATPAGHSHCGAGCCGHAVCPHAISMPAASSCRDDSNTSNAHAQNVSSMAYCSSLGIDQWQGCATTAPYSDRIARIEERLRAADEEARERRIANTEQKIKEIRRIQKQEQKLVGERSAQAWPRQLLDIDLNLAGCNRDLATLETLRHRYEGGRVHHAHCDDGRSAFRACAGHCAKSRSHSRSATYCSRTHGGRRADCVADQRIEDAGDDETSSREVDSSDSDDISYTTHEI